MAASTTTCVEQLLQHHNRAMAQRDLDQILEDYREDAVLIDPGGIFRGKQAIRAAFDRVLRRGVPLAPPTQQILEGEIVHLVWSVTPGQPGRQGAETLVIRDGKIVAQTVVAFAPPPNL